MNLELDALVAKEVMGWEWHEKFMCWYPPGIGATLAESRSPREWHPTSNVFNDYEVLVRVRETWDERKLTEFARALDGGWCKGYCIPFGYVRYQPGDYSRAALAVLGKGEQR